MNTAPVHRRAPQRHARPSAPWFRRLWSLLLHREPMSTSSSRTCGSDQWCPWSARDARRRTGRLHSSPADLEGKVIQVQYIHPNSFLSWAKLVSLLNSSRKQGIRSSSEAVAGSSSSAGLFYTSSTHTSEANAHAHDLDLHTHTHTNTHTHTHTKFTLSRAMQYSPWFEMGDSADDMASDTWG